MVRDDASASTIADRCMVDVVLCCVVGTCLGDELKGQQCFIYCRLNSSMPADVVDDATRESG